MNSHLDALPDELLLQVFKHLSDLGSTFDSSDDPWFIKHIAKRFRNSDRDEQPHAGLRAYPFLGQVSKKWKNLLSTENAKKLLWQQLVVDFGHELVTAIHMPLTFQSERPNAEEYTAAFHRVSLSSKKVIDFIMQRQKPLTSLVMSNSEGFWGDEGEYLSLQGKHNFQASHLGFLLGQLRTQLQELRLFNCNDLLTSDHGLWSLASMCPNLRVLAVEGINCRLSSQSMSELSSLNHLEKLCLVVDEHPSNSGQWLFGLDSMPDSWSKLKSLSHLELRGHQLLDTVPHWLKDLPALRHLDVSCNASISLGGLSCLTQLEVLVLQNLDLSQPMGADQQISPYAKRILPNLDSFSSKLTALSLSGNRFTRLPEYMTKLTSLEVLDFSGNKELQILAPLTSLIAAMPVIQIIDFRNIHKEKATTYWSDAKCTTMKYVAAAAKLLKRRKYNSRVMIDRD